MIQMFSNLFSMIATLFGAAERGANAIDSLAKWAEDETADFEKTAAVQRQAKLSAMKAELKQVS